MISQSYKPEIIKGRHGNFIYNLLRHNLFQPDIRYLEIQRKKILLMMITDPHISKTTLLIIHQLIIRAK